MLALALAALLLQQAGSPPRADSARADTLRAAATADSGAGADSTRKRRERPRVVRPVTDAVLRTAFADPAARALLERARAARTAQDSSLVAYDATAYQRVSVGMALRRFARDRLLFREEQATRVQWHRDRGVLADVQGLRSASALGAEVDMDIGGGAVPVPYVPGQETLWFGSGMAKVEMENDGPIHPLVRGAEAYYRYAVGDSVAFRLPNGRTIRLQELQIRPREPDWKLSVGSLWFDLDNAQLVRAVYRLSAPLEIWDIAEEDGDDDVPAAVKGLVNPLRASVRAVTIEYGLEGGRFWLPRVQSLEADAEVAFMRIPVKFEQSFRYRAVNGEVEVPERDVAADSADGRGSVSFGFMIGGGPDSARRIARLDSLAQAGDTTARKRLASHRRREAECAASGSYARQGTRFDGAVPITVRVPCDSAVLANSAALPGSIYDANDELFDARMQEALSRDVLGLMAQAGWGPQRPTLRFGVGDGLLRYNRVEGLAPAVRLEQQLGRGLTARAEARLGLADLEPNGELALARDDGRRTLRVSAYRRLAAANDWGEPLGFGASFMALAFGRDDGLYYRTLGAELAGEGSRLAGAGGGQLTWRLFLERQTNARQETNFSFARWANSNDFAPNITADAATILGFGWRWAQTWGFDPAGLRTHLVLRGEGGTAGAAYSRGLADVTVAHPLPARLDGALTLSGGTTAGGVPLQRQFFLGGPWTVRGLQPNTAAGEAFWLARAEVGTRALAARPVVFYDIGWAGARGDWRTPGTPLSGAGVGMSFLDGMIRADLARSIRPVQNWRLDLYLEGRF